MTASKLSKNIFDYKKAIKKLSCFVLTFFVFFVVGTNAGFSDTKLQETKKKIKNLKILEKKRNE